MIAGAASIEDPLFYTRFPSLFPELEKNVPFMLELAKIAFGNGVGHENPVATLPYCKSLMNLYLEIDVVPQQEAVRDYLTYVIIFTAYWAMAYGLDEKHQQDIVDMQLFRETHFPGSFPGSREDTARLYRLGQVSWSAGRCKESEDYFNRFIEKSPNIPDGYFGRAKARNRLLAHAGTIQDATRYLELIEMNVREEKESPTIKEDSNDQSLIDYLITDPKFRLLISQVSEMYSLRGHARYAAGDYSGAELDGREVIKGQTSYYEGYFLIGNALTEQERYLQAIPSMNLQKSLRRLIFKPSLRRLFKTFVRKQLVD